MIRLHQIEKTREMWSVWRWHEKAKADKTLPKSTDAWKEKLGSDMFVSILTYAAFALVEIGWVLMGLFTYNWLLFASLLVYSFLFNRLTKGVLKKYQDAYVFSTNFNLILFIVAYTFAIINTFHLHIDLVKLIFGA